jgi:hypothetical protein
MLGARDKLKKLHSKIGMRVDFSSSKNPDAVWIYALVNI